MSLSPPVSQGDYHYQQGDFYVSTKQNRHRRATIPELHTLFHPPIGQAPPKDHPAHWYRAQLLHYGLQPSDNKGTAAKRLLDAVNHDQLAVPNNLRLLEKELKKEWDSNERKARKERANCNKVKKTPAKRTKSGASNDIAAVSAAVMASLPTINGNVNFTWNIGGDTPTAVQNATNKRKAKGSAEEKDQKPTKRQNCADHTATTPHNPPETPKSKVTKQTARKGVQSRPKVNETKETKVRAASPRNFQSAPKLGLINGIYDLDAEGPDTRNSGLKLRLQDKSVWGEFQLDRLSGVLFMPERPWGVFHPGYDDIHQACFFEWRAIDQSRGDAPLYGPSCTGMMKFLGDGRIQGTFNSMIPDSNGELFDCDFWGERVSGGVTKPPQSAWSLQDRFEAIGARAAKSSYYNSPGGESDDPPPPYYSDDPLSNEDFDTEDVW
ncbi:hypothetical protein FE257_007776 [Aspergillus nanangensis]|uniref:Uncharacterized protein n=1 Tax=Aspergillus nanangensis TaxID=2582783 RepID=A0AAD4CX03_ASPNN|nr:hypothetical protein FE257_007776 [Aspergillus nanangensis]